MPIKRKHHSTLLLDSRSCCFGPGSVLSDSVPLGAHSTHPEE
jgi:hypothetical protein